MEPLIYIKGRHHPIDVFFFNNCNLKVICGHQEGFGTKINNFYENIDFDPFWPQISMAKYARASYPGRFNFFQDSIILSRLDGKNY